MFLKIKKRQITALMVILFIFASLGVYAEQNDDMSDDVTGTAYENSIVIMNKLGFISYSKNEHFGVNDPITRGEFAGIVGRIINSDYSSGFYFTDVTEDVENFNQINYLAKYGIISGNNEKFNPNNNITLSEAQKIILNALGYCDIAKAKGGYPTGYKSVAVNLGLGSYGENLKKGDAIKFLADACEVNILQTIGSENNNLVFSDKSGETLLSQYHDIYIKEAIMNATQYSGLSTPDKACGTDRVVIGDTEIRITDNSVEDYLGYELKAYYKEQDDVNRLIVAVPTIKNTVFTLNAKDVISYKDGIYKYNDKNNKECEVKVSKIADLIWNKKAVVRTMANDLYIPGSGSITFVDPNGGKNYSVVSVKSYKTYVVDRYDTYNHIITDRFGQPDLKLDKEGTQSQIIIDNEKIILKNASGILKKNTVLKVYADYEKSVIMNGEKVIFDRKPLNIADTDKATFIEIEVDSRDINTGKLTQINESENEVEFDDTTYEIAPEYKFALVSGKTGIKDLVINLNYEFIVDADNRILPLDTSKKSFIGKYGFLMGFMRSHDIDGVQHIKILTDDNKKNSYEMSSSFKINEKNVKNIEDVSELYQDGKIKQQLIYFSCDKDGKINNLDTACMMPKNDNITDYQDKFTCHYSHRAVSGLGYGDEKGGMQFCPSATFNTKYDAANSIVFVVPSQKNPDGSISVVSSNDEQYLAQKNYFTRTTYDNLDFYDVQPNLAVNAIVYYNLSGGTKGTVKVDINEPMTVVDRVVAAVNSKKDSCYKLYGYRNGGEVELEMSDTVDFETDEVTQDQLYKGYKITDLKRGDVIQTSVNTEGKLVSFRIIAKDTATTTEGHEGLNGTDYCYTAHIYDTVYFGYGKIEDLYDNVFYVNTRNTDEREKWRTFLMRNGNYYVYDVKSDKISLGSSNDAAIGDYVVGRCLDSAMSDLLIIKR